MLRGSGIAEFYYLGVIKNLVKNRGFLRSLKNGSGQPYSQVAIRRYDSMIVDDRIVGIRFRNIRKITILLPCTK